MPHSVTKADRQLPDWVLAELEDLAELARNDDDLLHVTPCASSLDRSQRCVACRINEINSYFKREHEQPSLPIYRQVMREESCPQCGQAEHPLRPMRVMVNGVFEPRWRRGPEHVGWLVTMACRANHAWTQYYTLDGRKGVHNA